MNEFDTTPAAPTQLQWISEVAPAVIGLAALAALIVTVWSGYRAAAARGWGLRIWLTLDPVHREHERMAARIRATWPALAHANRMSRKHPGLTARRGRRRPARLRKPQTPPIRTRVDAHGIDIHLFPLNDGVDLADDAKLARAATKLAAAWGGRLSWKPRPGGGWLLRLELSAPNPNPPASTTADPAALWGGRDERTDPFYLNLAATPSIGIHGDSVRASRFVASLLAQMAPNPGVAFIVFDGKTPDPRTGDYGFLANHPRARLFGDDITQARTMLAYIVAHRRQRAELMLPATGNTDFWATGPRPDCPLIVVVVDGYDTFLTGSTAAARANREAMRDLLTLGGRAGIAQFLTANASIPKRGLGEHLSGRITFDSAATRGTSAAARRAAATNSPGMATMEHLTGATRFQAAALTVALAEAATATHQPQTESEPVSTVLGLPPTAN